MTSAERDRKAQQRAAEKERKKRQKAYEKSMKARERQAQYMLNQSQQQYANQRASTAGMLGMYGTLNSGVGANTLATADRDAMTAQGKLAADLAAETTATQAELARYNEQNMLDWAKMYQGDDQYYANLDLQQQRADLEGELGRGELGLSQDRLTQEGEQFDKKLAHESGESAEDRAHALALQAGQQEWQTGESAADRAARQALQTGQQQWQTGESGLGREHEVALQQLVQQYQAGEAEKARVHDVTLQTGAQTWQTGENAAARGATAEQAELDRQAASASQDKTIANQIKMLALELEDREKSRGAEADQAQMQFAIQLQQLAAQIEQNQAQNEISIAGLNQQSEQYAASNELDWARLDQTGDLQQQQLELAKAEFARTGDQQALDNLMKAMQLAGQGLNLSNPMAQMAIGRLVGGDGVTADPNAIPTRKATPGQWDRDQASLAGPTSYEQQLAEMSDYWNQQRAKQGNNQVFNYTGGGGYGYNQPTDLDYYNAQTRRYEAVNRGGGYGGASAPVATGGGGMNNPGLSGWSMISQSDRPAVERVVSALGRGQLPNMSQSRLQYYLGMAADAGLIDELRLAETLLKLSPPKKKAGGRSGDDGIDLGALANFASAEPIV